MNEWWISGGCDDLDVERDEQHDRRDEERQEQERA